MRRIQLNNAFEKRLGPEKIVEGRFSSLVEPLLTRYLGASPEHINES